MSKPLSLHSGINTIAHVPGVGITLATGDAAIADNSVGYAPGCVYVRTGGSGESNFLYANVGTAAAANFDAIDLNVSEAALLSGLTATSAELNRATDVSSRIVPLAVSTAITEALHEGRTIVMSGAGGARTFTMPAATGGGGRYRFVVGEVNTSNYLIKSAVGTDLMEGIIIGASTTDSATDAARTWLSGATDDTITLNGTTMGGVAVGDWIELEDISATGWAVRGMVTQSGSEVTPFSDTVT
jgi:hypothetical protein